jgi:hypothetical protein
MEMIQKMHLMAGNAQKNFYQPQIAVNRDP